MNSVPGLESGEVHHQPRLGRNKSFLQLERRHVPDPAIRERRPRARPADIAAHGETHRQPSDLRRLPDPRLQPDLRHLPQTELWELANYTIKPRLNRVNGVSMVVLQGGQVPEFHIDPDPAKLLQAQVTVPGILDAVAKSNMIDSPGLIENNHELSLDAWSPARPKTPPKSATSWCAPRPPAFPSASPISRRCMPSVMPVYTIVTANGKPAVLLNIFRQPDSNTVAVADAARRGARPIRKPCLPA